MYFVLLLLAIAPGAFFLHKIYKADCVEKEPIGLLTKLFVAGCIIVIPICVAEVFIDACVTEFFEEGSFIYNIIDNFICAALVEEYGKYLIVKKLAWKNKNFDHVFDGIVYAVFASIGFAVIENIFYVLDGGFDVAIMRAILSVPGHGIYSIFMGHYLGLAKLYEKKGDMKLSRKNIKSALFVPVLLHGIYDFCLSSENGVLIVLLLMAVIVMYIVAFQNLSIYAKNDEKIIDIDSDELSVYRITSEVQLYRYNEPEPGLFIAESAKVIMRALDCGYEPVSILYDKNQFHEELKLLLERLDGSIPVYESDTDTLKNITGFNLTRGVLCAMKRRNMPQLLDICSEARRIAVLDDIENPTNVGAIFRSAAAMGIDALVLTAECADPLYRRSIRVSMGNVFLVPFTVLNKGEDYVSELKAAGYTSIAMALEEDSVSIDSAVLKNQDKIAIILGNEGEGLRPEIISKCDYTAMIPMMNGVDSLNVAAASAVAFWEVK